MGGVLVAVLALATGLAVSQAGLVAFVGLAAPHLVRSVVRTTHARLVGLSALAGGVLLLWVAWRMYRDIGADHGTDSPGSPEITGDEDSGIKPAKSFVGAAWAVAIADVSMSLDNVLAVAGAAKCPSVDRIVHFSHERCGLCVGHAPTLTS